FSLVLSSSLSFSFFSSHAPATTELYTLSLHDALPIYAGASSCSPRSPCKACGPHPVLTDFRFSSCHQPKASIFSLYICLRLGGLDRKSTRLNSSHVKISYAVFCLKKKNNNVIKNKLQ